METTNLDGVTMLYRPLSPLSITLPLSNLKLFSCLFEYTIGDSIYSYLVIKCVHFFACILSISFTFKVLLFYENLCAQQSHTIGMKMCYLP